ncbi:MAG: WG repeat-containing protein, partial [Bacteroidales bacterium]|nr:WG repeat-containing protein [Bacteroidales bacterium]
LGFINDKGKVVVKPTYDNIGQFGEYKSDWALVTLNGKNGFINSQGKFIRHRRKQ